MAQPLQIQKTSYSVLDFLEWQRQGTLDLQPFYQRRPVWNPRIKSLLIDSIIRGFPIPLIFLHSRLDVSTSRSVRQVVDGQQRLRTILSFIDPDCIDNPDERDNFRILRSHNKEYAGRTFAELPDEVQADILQTAISVNILPPDVADVTILEIFQRMNTTGLKLTEQEIRNGSYFGEFKDLAYALSYEQNQRWMDWNLFTPQEVAQMQEVEFASDLMGALLRGVSGRSHPQITALYRDYDEAFPQQDRVAADFRESFERLAPLYDGRVDPPLPKRFRSTSWFYPLFAIVSGLSDTGSDPKNDLSNGLPASAQFDFKFPIARLAEALVEVDRRIATKGELPDELAESLRRQTTHKASRLQRIRLVRSVL